MKFTQYVTELNNALASVDQKKLNAAYKLISRARIIYVAGNGGSAAISDHLCCDFFKSDLRVYSLVSNVALNTMLANDYGYENAIANQVVRITKDDILILISSSGKSSNMIIAAKTAKGMGIPIISLTGFSGGELSKLSTVSIHVETLSYGVTEDAHQSIMHYLARMLSS